MNSYDSILQMCYDRYLYEFSYSTSMMWCGGDEPQPIEVFECTYFEDEDLMYELLPYDEYQMYLQAKKEYEF